MRLSLSVLLALTIGLANAAPQNKAEVNEKQAETSEVAKKKGDSSALSKYQNDMTMIRTCVSGLSCEFRTVGNAKALAPESIISIEDVKAETDVTKALSPTLMTMSESIRSLQAQKALLESLEAQMEALTSASSKGQQLAAAADNNLIQAMTKGLELPPASPPKGVMAPMMPPSKGVPRAPSKGGSFASSMALEATMCPLMMYELGKSKKANGEMKLQLEASNAMNAQLLVEKQRLEAALAASEAMRAKAEQQAEFNAKYAAEQKSKAEMLANGLALCNAEKEMVKSQKAELEVELQSTQSKLSEETAKNAALTDELAACNEAKAELATALQEQTARAEVAEAQLADTKARLEEETDARISCEETLSFTQARLERSEADLVNERQAREDTEEELTQTMTDLAACQKENRVTAEILARTQDELQEKIAALARAEAARDALQGKLEATVEELRATEQQLRETRRALEDEQNAHATTQRQLRETQEELEACQTARDALEEAKQKLEDELAETKSQLEVMTAERDQLQITLDTTSELLANTTSEKMKCESDLAAQKVISDQLSENLSSALAMLKMEKEAREELTATIAVVQETSMKVQEEVKKLQAENIALQAQVEKLKNEQEVALALAAGCPPTYEKFGASCYKYVREKTQWKMAQEQCMKDSGNLIAIESTEEQIFVTNYLKRHGANDPYAYTSGNKQYNGWKWLGAENNHIGASGAEYWYNAVTKQKPGYDCQAMYLYDAFQYGKWVGLPCYTAAPYVCEYQLLPPGTSSPANGAEQMAILDMAKEAPPYLGSAARRY